MHNNIIYSNNEKIIIERNDTQMINNKIDIIKKINNKVFNVDTNTYENIIYNKKEVAINLFNKLNSCINSISKDIIRNYLVKNVVYKLNNKILEIQVNQNNLLVSFHKSTKQFDLENRLFKRKGYENNSINYSLVIEDNKDCEYAIKLVKELYSYIKTPPESLPDKLYNLLKENILTMSNLVTFHNTNKGLVFKVKRNFAILSKTKYGVYVRLLKVKNEDNILDIVTRKKYEPLCLSYKVKEMSDIDVLIPYIKDSLELGKINPLDLKYGLNEYYITE